MLAILRDIFFIFLIILGLVELIRMVLCHLLKSKAVKNLMILVPIRGHCEDAEVLLRSAAAKISWVYSGAIEKVICLDCGADEETRQLCKKICEEYPFMEYKTKVE